MPRIQIHHFHFQRKCITYSQYQSKLEEVIATIGLNPEEYSTYSMRRGGTSFAYKSQVPIDLIKLHGDWKSHCYQKYLSFSIEDKLLVASNMRKCILAISTVTDMSKILELYLIHISVILYTNECIHSV